MLPISNELLGEETVTRICTRILEESAPHELSLLPKVVHLYWTESGRGSRSGTDDSVPEEPLAFGAGDDLLMTIIIPVVIAVLTKVSTGLYDELKTALKRDKQAGKPSAVKKLLIESCYDQTSKSLILKIGGRLSRKTADELGDRILEVIAEYLVAHESADKG
jgi:hypothetical protein